jgi:hypothetical protein
MPEGQSRREYLRWLAALKVGDSVAVYCGSNRLQVATVTSAPRTFVTIGKHAKKTSFRRKTGRICGRRPMSHLFRIERP